MSSFEEAKIQPGSFKDVCDGIEALLLLFKDYEQLSKCFEYTEAKKESEFIEYQHRESVIERVLFRDRSHPVDTVIINNFNRKNGTNLESVKMIYGPSSDEYTRSHHALAIAVADMIYFRNGAYKPETEEGRKLIAHELTHVAQNQDKENYRNVSKEEKESEAEAVEQSEVYNPDKLVKKMIGGKEYLLKESVWKKIEKDARRKLEEKIIGLEHKMPEQEYLKLLLKYEEWEKRERIKWDSL